MCRRALRRVGKIGRPCWTSGGRFAKRPALDEGFFRAKGSGRIAQLVEQLTLNQRVPGSSPGAPTKEKATFSSSFAGWRSRTSGSRATFFCRPPRGRIAVRLFLASVSSPHSKQRADPMVQVDYVLIVEKDIRASKTDNLFCSVAAGYGLLQNQNRIVRVGGSIRSLATPRHDFHAKLR